MGLEMLLLNFLLLVALAVAKQINIVPFGTATNAGERRLQPGGGMGGGDILDVDCDVADYAGETQYIGNGPRATPLLGTIACITADAIALRGDEFTSRLIYGPFEAGFTSDQIPCLGDEAIAGGADTLTATGVANYFCQDDSSVELLDYCGGHAVPFHYHESLSCLYESSTDPNTTGHSTRVGTALDGNGIYGKYVTGGVEPTDLDACGGRYGVTPDSEGETVYYYVIQDEPPFTLGCFGPATFEECRALYDECDDDDVTLLNLNVAGEEVNYDLWCPCFENGSNVESIGVSDDTALTTEMIIGIAAASVAGVSLLAYGAASFLRTTPTGANSSPPGKVGAAVEEQKPAVAAVAEQKQAVAAVVEATPAEITL